VSERKKQRKEPGISARHRAGNYGREAQRGREARKRGEGAGKGGIHKGGNEKKIFEAATLAIILSQKR